MRGKTLEPEAAQRERQAIELRLSGLDYTSIAEKIGYSGPGAAYKVVQRALKRTLREPAEELRGLDADRLDKLLLGVWYMATRGQPESVDRVLRILERRAKLLGLDAPAKYAPTSPDGKETAAVSVGFDFDGFARAFAGLAGDAGGDVPTPDGPA